MPGHVIKKYREMKNFSQTYVASKLGMSQNAYSKIENNITQLTVHHVKELSKILDVPVTDLLRDEFEIHKPVTIPHTVTRQDLLDQLTLLKKKLDSRQASKHHNYIVAMSLIAAADNAISSVH
jgi:transcriptional regulator with XRE-family HTH domain